MKWRPIVIAGLICAAVAGIVHPDFQGKKPTHELIERLHREHLERQEAIHSKLNEVHQHLIAKQVTGNDRHAPGAPASPASGDRRAGYQAGGDRRAG
jgi:hypothetical protein